MRYRIVAAVAFSVVAAAFVCNHVQAGSGQQTAMQQGAVDSFYLPDTNYQAFRSNISVVDTLTTTGILAIPSFHVRDHTTLMVGARFSVSGATVQVQWAYVFKLIGTATSDTDVTAYPFSGGTAAGNTIKGYSPVITLTAGTTEYEGSYYPAPDYFFDADRANEARLLVVGAPSSGTVTFWVGS
jgi:hypothetical protein